MIERKLTDEQAKLAADNVGLAYQVAAERSATRPWAYDNILDGAMDGLFTAALKFRPEMGCRFSTLAWRVIHQGVTCHVRTLARKQGAGIARTVRFDPEIHGDAFAVDARHPDESPDFEGLIAGVEPRRREVLRRRYAEEHTLEEIGEDLGVTRERVRQLQETAQAKIAEGIAA